MNDLENIDGSNLYLFLINIINVESVNKYVLLHKYLVLFDVNDYEHIVDNILSMDNVNADDIKKLDTITMLLLSNSISFLKSYGLIIDNDSEEININNMLDILIAFGNIFETSDIFNYTILDTLLDNMMDDTERVYRILSSVNSEITIFTIESLLLEVTANFFNKIKEIMDNKPEEDDETIDDYSNNDFKLISDILSKINKIDNNINPDILIDCLSDEFVVPMLILNPHEYLNTLKIRLNINSDDRRMNVYNYVIASVLNGISIEDIKLELHEIIDDFNTSDVSTVFTYLESSLVYDDILKLRGNYVSGEE